MSWLLNIIHHDGFPIFYLILISLCIFGLPYILNFREFSIMSVQTENHVTNYTTALKGCQGIFHSWCPDPVGGKKFDWAVSQKR